MTKGELAQQYFPGRDPHGATNRLREWINRCHGLHESLTAAGYTDHQRMLTARQVQLIVEYLGEP